MPSPSVRAWPRHPVPPLDVVVVLPAEDRSVITPPDAGYDRYLQGQAASWLEAAACASRRASSTRTNVRFADSFAEGLVAAAEEFGASHIVVGAANGGLRGRHRLGSVATELLHSSNVPVVLAPEGSRRIDPATGVTRITAAIGTRPGADALLDEATSLADGDGRRAAAALARDGRSAGERRHRRHPGRRGGPRRPGARSGARGSLGRQRRRSRSSAEATASKTPSSTSAGSRASWRSSPRAGSRSRAACSSARPLRRCFMNCPFP